MKKQLNSYKYQVERAIKRKVYLIELRGGACEKCGYKKNIAALELHHKNPKEKQRKLDSRHLSNSTMNDILKEFEKCIILCANCHRENHNPDLDYTVVKSTIKKINDRPLRISKGKPKCIDCKKEINYSYKRCTSCNNKYKRKTKWPKRAVLETEKEKNGTFWCAKKYGVSTKTIRRWINNPMLK